MKVIGLTGTIASGKTSVKDAITRKKSADYVTLSSLIMEETIKKRGLSVDRFNKQNLGNELRQRYGNDVLVKTAWNFMQKNKEILIIDGIRNPGEVEFLRKNLGKDFVLIAVDAPRELRWQRVQSRNRPTDPKTFEEFIKLDERDQGANEPEYGQQVRKCIEMADFVLDGAPEYNLFLKNAEEIVAKI